MLTDEQLRFICAEPLLPPITLMSLPDTYPWVAVLRGGRKRMPGSEAALKLEYSPGAIFTGPQGNGRHSTAYALANTLCRDFGGKAALRCICGDDLELEDRSDMFKLLEYVTRTAQDSGALILLLDQPGDDHYSMMFQRYLVRIQRQLKAVNILLYLIIIAGSADEVNRELLNSLPRYHCMPPDRKAVKQWAERIMETPVPIRIEKMSAADVAAAAQGLSWKQLSDLHDALRRLLILHYALNAQNYRKNGLTEEMVYAQGKIVLPKAEVSPILAAASAQKVQLAAQTGVMTTSFVQTVAANTDSVSAAVQEEHYESKTDEEACDDFFSLYE